MTRPQWKQVYRVNGSGECFCLGRAALLGILAALLLASSVMGQRRNEFGPLDTKCRDACGPDCPDTCDKSEFNECTEDGKAIIVVTRYTCGTHQGCRDHDDCLDACFAPYDYGNLPGTDFTLADVEFWAGPCQLACHAEAYEYADNLNGRPAETAHSWANGGGPYDGTDTWDYTRDKRDGPDRTLPCGECESCFGGVCFPEDDCEPCNSCNDVHLYTLDGLKFDFQAAGEFTLVASQSRSFVLQARQEPYGSKATVNTAVAMNVAGTRVGIYVPEILRVDGAKVVLNQLQSLELASGGTVRRLKRAYMISWPDGSRVSVRLRGRHLNIGVVLAEQMKGSVRGILGNFDGDETNDLFSASGDQFSKPFTFEKLHRQYGDTWRIHQQESLFDYDSGKSTATYQLLDFPKQHVRSIDLAKSDRDRAEEICRNAGVIGDAQFEDCVFDVALTGDKVFAENNARSKTVVREVVRIEDSGAATNTKQPAAQTEASNVVLHAPDDLLVGSNVEITIDGTTKENDFITIVAPGSPPSELGNRNRVRGKAVSLDLPTDAGSYEVRYVTAASPRTVVARLAVAVRPLNVSLESPGEVGAADEIVVVVRGTMNSSDFITVVPVGSPEDELHRKARMRISEGTLGLEKKRTLRLTAPEEAGAYEIRYVTHAQPRKTYATVPIQVN